ncbi:MAG: DNA repair protein RadC [Gammaproteobacteria bacterium]
MAITDWPMQERPREKLLHHGANALSEAELLAVLFRTGVKGKTAVDIAREAINKFGSLHKLLNASPQHLCQEKGFGIAKYVQLQCAVEIGRRHLQASLQNEDVLRRPEETRLYLLSQLRDHDHEVFACLFLNKQNRIICFEKLFNGTIDCANIHPRTILQKALNYNAAAIILAHNHPSGDPAPSQSDKEITLILNNLLGYFDINLLDHFIIGNGETFSFVEAGLMQKIALASKRLQLEDVVQWEGVKS